MPLANMRDVMRTQKAQGKALGAFSVSSLEMIEGVLRAAETLGEPVLLQVAQCRLNVTPLALIGPCMLAAARNARVPVCVHLDHGLTLDCVKEALALGFTSVMIDGSTLQDKENIALTRQVMAMARPYGAAVEAEIGVVGRTESGGDQQALCADPTQARQFLAETQVDALAVAIGNAHGVYAGTPKLRFDVLEQLQPVDTPLVLHGGTGISDGDFRRCIRLGMTKINIATATFQAVTLAAQGAPDFFEMAKRMQDAAYAVTMHHLRVFSGEEA